MKWNFQAVLFILRVTVGSGRGGKKYLHPQFLDVVVK